MAVAAKRKTKAKQPQVGVMVDLGYLAASIAHEINNPLATIKLCIETTECLLKNNRALPPLVAEQFTMVQKSLDRIAKLTSQMAQLTRDDEPVFENTKLADVVNDICRLYAHKMILSEVNLSMDIDPDAKVFCDSCKIQQVLINVLNNAIYALEKRPENRQLEIRMKQKRSQIDLEVWNNGVPIPENIQGKIFTPFFTDKPIGKGTGIGLPVSRDIMSLHDGELSFFSSEKQGTCFILSFPQKKLRSVK